MKTALQQVIQEVENYFDKDLSNSNNVLILLKSYLETEKQQIIDAYDSGIKNEYNGADMYYTSTFETNKETLK